MKMRTLPVLLCVLAASATVVHSGEQTERHCLWEVRSDTGTVYLLGSVHALTADVHPLPAAITEAYDAADRLVFEVDLDEMQDAAMHLLARGTLPRGTKLPDVVSAETWQAARGRLNTNGLDVKGFDSMKPWMLAMTLLNFELTRAGYTSANGIDFHFHRRARSDNKPVAGLETAEFQISLFDRLDREMGENLLRYTLADLDRAIPMLEEITDAWHRGDGDALDTMLNEGFEEFPELFSKLVTARNEAWMRAVEDAAAEPETTMFVVGALHLVGDDGLVNRLSRLGYRVTQQ